MNAKELFDKARELVQEQNDHGVIQELIDQGLDVNQKDEYDTSLAARAIYGAINYSALHALWKAKAIPTTDYVKEIFTEFENGKTAEQFYQEDIDLKTAKKDAVKLDLSDNFSVDQLVLKEVFYEFTPEIEDEQDAEIELRLSFEDFLYEDHITTPSMVFLGFSSAELEAAVFSTGCSFGTDHEIEGDSIYVQSVHNPVDLKFLKIERGAAFDLLEIELFFDFEYERTSIPNQSLKINYKLKK